MKTFYGIDLPNPLMLGTAQYPSPAILERAFRESGAGVATVSLRREGAGGAGQAFWQIVRNLGVLILPNTAGCRTVKEAVTTAHMAREVFDTKWIKLELIGHTDSLQPDVFQLVEAARILTEDGFQVFPYTTEDLIVAERLLMAGCEALMPWGAPIGSGRGLNNEYALRAMRAEYPDVPLVIDAGIGLPSHAAHAMELGYDAVLLNTAVARAGNPVVMARAMMGAIQAGRLAHEADPIAGARHGRSLNPRDWKGVSVMTLDRFYPIFDHSNWLRRMLPLGVKLVQLRLKDQPDVVVHDQIAISRDLCRDYGAVLVVNDHWQAAIDLGCNWVHLGQEDLDEADLVAIRRAGLKLGVSTHDDDELERVLTMGPDYVALGPVFPTILKKMKWHQQGLPRVTEWKARVGDVPLVGIGGMSVERSAGVFDAGADIVSAVTDIILNADPEGRARQWIEATR